MGVPKFYRWLSERYPKVNQRIGRIPEESTILEHFGEDVLNEQRQQRNQPTSMSMSMPDPISMCSTVPPIDRLYIDMNGIIHGCSHNNASNNNADDDTETISNITEKEIFQNVCYYLDRIIKDIIKPKQLVYMAIDGVAPRAKLNQQRSRRYRSGKEGEIETTIYDAHMKKIQQEQEQEELLLNNERLGSQDDNEEGDMQKGGLFFEEEVYNMNDNKNHKIKSSKSSSSSSSSSVLEEVEPGRYAGKIVATLDDNTTTATTGISDTTNTSSTSSSSSDIFHSNNITPGTPFFTRCTNAIIHFIKYKISTDPTYKDLTIIFSGPNVPGEGEHKIMQFIREQKYQYEQQIQKKNNNNNKTDSNNNNNNNNNNNDTNNTMYHPNLRHCIMGQDGDLIMLGLITHEPNLVLLREQVIFDSKRRAQLSDNNNNNDTTSTALARYIHNTNFELLHMNILRDYFAYEFETNNVITTSTWDIEHCIDDFVFLTFFVGNDFLPHMPAIDIADEAFDLLFYTYRDQRKYWLKEYNKSNNNNKKLPYLINHGNIICGQRLENFLQVLGKHETSYLQYKKDINENEQDIARKIEEKYGMNTIPTDDVIAIKEQSDRELFRKRIVQKIINGDDNSNSSSNNNNIQGFRPVLSSTSSNKRSNRDEQRNNKKEVLMIEDEDEDTNTAEALSKHMGGLLRVSITGGGGKDGEDNNNTEEINIDDQDLKGRYYSDKFGFSPFDAEKHVTLRKAYIEGLVWNLKYYFQGCVSWDWYYPYHYGPMLSDLINIQSMLDEITCDDNRLGKPLQPFEQLLACMPPSFAEVLPEPYRNLMTDNNSPIADFYPISFTIDMNGKRWPWEAVVLLPFIDSKRLLDAVSTVNVSQLTDDEIKRNQFGEVSVYTHDDNAEGIKIPGIGEGSIFGTLDQCKTKEVTFESTPWYVDISKNHQPILKPKLIKGTEVPLPGFPTLRDGTVQGLWRKLLRVNIHGNKSRYATACLEIANPLPEILSTEVLAENLNGTLIWINYPHFIEAFVTAVSDSQGIIRGKAKRKQWNAEDALARKSRVTKIVDNYVFGEKMVGTGGIALIGGEESMDNLDILLYVRPFAGFKTMPDGTVVKTFAKFEVEVPLFVTGWAPMKIDAKILNLPCRLEKDPFNATDRVITIRNQTENVLKKKKNASLSSRLRRTRLSLARNYHTSAERGFCDKTVNSVDVSSWARKLDTKIGLSRIGNVNLTCSGNTIRQFSTALSVRSLPPPSSYSLQVALPVNRLTRQPNKFNYQNAQRFYSMKSSKGRLITYSLVAAFSFFSGT